MGYIGKVNIGGTQHLVASTLYGTCSTAAATAEKTVTLADFDQLINGTTIHIYFTNNNTAENPSLNVNGTGKLSIYRYGTTAPSTSAASSWNAGAVVSFTYDSSNNGCWRMNDWINNDTSTSQNLRSTNANYPVIFSSKTVGSPSTSSGAVYRNNSFYYNPSDNAQLLTVPNVNITNGSLILGSQGKQGILTLYTPNSSIAETVTISSQSHGRTNINHYLPTNTADSHLLNTAYIDGNDISINNGLLKVRNLAETLMRNQVISRDTIIPDSNNPYSDDTRTVIIGNRPVTQNFSISLGSLEGYVLIIYGRPYDSSNHYLENIGSKIVHKDFFWKATQSSSPTNICLSLIGDIGSKVYIRKKAYNIVSNNSSFTFNPVSGSGRTVTIDGSSVSTSSNDNCLILYALIEIQVNE